MKNYCASQDIDGNPKTIPIGKRCGFDKNFICHKEGEDKPICKCSDGFKFKMFSHSPTCEAIESDFNQIASNED
uniref:Uncharacterized protein n=1 Tax=Acrobeloides nanus TaxID=290746 RepID=A0A914C6J7_9BILA